MSDSKQPEYHVYSIRERTNGKDILTQIGVAFKRNDGEGVTIFLDALPLDRKIVAIPPLKGRHSD